MKIYLIGHITTSLLTLNSNHLWLYGINSHINYPGFYKSSKYNKYKSKNNSNIIIGIITPNKLKLINNNNQKENYCAVNELTSDNEIIKDFIQEFPLNNNIPINYYKQYISITITKDITIYPCIIPLCNDLIANEQCLSYITSMF